jgi:hypothetical protein
MLTFLRGVVILLFGGWFVPREMKRIHDRLVEGGKDPSSFDAKVEGVPFRAARALAMTAGAAAIAVGGYWLVHG